MENIPTLIPVVAAALRRSDGFVLMQRRKITSAHGGLWEFPGGKVQQGETLEAALIRELQEELAITVAPDSLLPVTFASDPVQPPNKREPYCIFLYLCTQWEGEPQCLDADAFKWFATDEILTLNMPPLDIPLAKALQSMI